MISKRLIWFGAALGLMTAGMVSGRAQSFTGAGGIGFDASPDSANTAVLGDSIQIDADLYNFSDGYNDYDENSSDPIFGSIDVYDTIYVYEDLTTGDYFYSTNTDNGDYEYEDFDTDSTYWSNTDYGNYQYENFNNDSTYWSDTFYGDYQYESGWSDTFYGYYKYDFGWTDTYYGTYEYQDSYTGETVWTDTYYGDPYFDGEDYWYIIDELDDELIGDVIGQIIGEKVDSYDQYYYYAPWFVYAYGGYDAETTVTVSDNAGNNNAVYTYIDFNPDDGDSLSFPLQYEPDSNPGPDIHGTLTVEDTDPNAGDGFYTYCDPDAIYSVEDASGSTSYTFLNPNTDVSAAVHDGSDDYTEDDLVESVPPQSVSFRIYRGDNYNNRTVYYTISGAAVNGSDYSASFSGSVTFTAGGADYVDIPVSTKNNVGGPVDLTLTLESPANYDSNPYQVNDVYDSATIWFLPNPQATLTLYGSSQLTESETPQSSTIEIALSQVWVDTYANCNVGGSAQNGLAYSAPWSGNSFYVYFPASSGATLYADIPVSTYQNISSSQVLNVSLASDTDFYQIGSPSSTSITFLPNTSNPTSGGSGTSDGGSAQTFQPLPSPYNNVFVASQRSGFGSGGVIAGSGNPSYAMVNVQAVSPYATGVGPTPGVFTITRSGGTNAITVNYTLTGTAVSGVNYAALPASVTLATNQASTNLSVNVLTGNPVTSAQTVVLTLNGSSSYVLGNNPQAVVTLLPNSSATNSVATPAGRYWRGSGSDPTYWSLVVPLDYEAGVVYSNLNGNASSLYPGLPSGAWSSQTLYHYNATNLLTQTNAANRIPFNNPIVAFGERTGGTPLYFSQPYNFGVYAGDPLLAATQIVIQVYNRSNDQLAGSIQIAPPNYFSTNSMAAYATNGFQVSTNAFGLTTTLSDSPSLNWGAASLGAYVLTHTASALASNYYYLVEASGYPAAGSNAMAINAGGAAAPSLLYSLEFEARPPWRSIFLDQPQFTGNPMPPVYAGKTVDEMLTNTPPVTNVVNFNPSAATTLDDSPELRRHPTLDNFVASMGNDPIALANYVINNIDLTDPMDYSDSGNVAEQAINPGGVSRGALGTFMEKQGSPVDQCALLVYLLRQAGVPAVYEFAPRNGLMLLDARLSQMLKFQVQGAASEAGQLYTTNSMIAVNYPWVAAYIGTNWVHIFPWLKDYKITEGLNLYEYMPTNYSSAYPWVRDYIYGNANLLALGTNGDNTPSVIFPAYLKQTLLQNHPGISVDDIGVQILNRQHYYPRWQDFPTPTWVTNVSTPLESLTSSGITNISPTLTNIFDTLSVQIYSVSNPTNSIQTGNLRMVDLHNREFYIYQTNNPVNTNQIQLSLILLPFRTNVTTQFAFTNDAALLSREVLTMNLGTNETQLGVRFAYQRHRALSSAYPIDPNAAFLGYNGSESVNLERPLLKGDQAAICLDYGRVTQDMLNVHAQDIWQMEYAIQLNPSLTNSISPDVYEGAVMYLAGMSYYKNVSDFNVLNENLHKVNILSSWAAGLSKLGAARDTFGYLTNGMVLPVLPSVDMFYYETALVGNGTVQPDSGQTLQTAQQNYNLISIVNNSAEEHQIINNFYQQTNAVSTVRLLQLSQIQGTGIVPLNFNNYLAQGQVVYQGQALQSWDPGLWSQVAAALQNSPYTIAYITPGPITNSAYSGMAALILGWNQWQALITPGSLNGATGSPLPPGSVSPGNTDNYDLNNGSPYWLNFNPSQPDSALAPTGGSPLDYANNLNQLLNNDFANSSFDSNYFNNFASTYNLSTALNSQNEATDYETAAQNGFLGQGANISQFGTSIFDPVQTITGEHYIDETDLQLPGPLPLALRRNYSSQNLADNQFGTGWKLSIMPYLSVTAGQTNIFAADMDGAVLAYVRTNASVNVWVPTLAVNPQLNNNTTAGAGGLVNRLRDRIVQTVNGSTTNYTLYGADGSIRAFQVMSFNNGILNQTRPYLQTWTDNRGNYYKFTYGTASTQPGFGQVVRIQCSNGNYLGLDYDVNAHIIDAFCGDGRRLTYAYDQYGDLVKVTLPDNTTRSYIYQHATQAVTNAVATFSTHLIIEEDKPDGRTLQNMYDSQRRVTNQLSTAGASLTPIRTATFVFSNNFAITNSYTNGVSGYTLIIDGNNHTNRYDYTNNLITKITDPLGQTIQQTWYPDNATAPGYPRSLSQVVDKRGMTNLFKYDANGNVTNNIIYGDLTGDGIATQTATNTAVYNSNNLPVQMTDPVGNGTVTVYDPVFNFLPQQVIRYAGTTPVSTNFIFYADATNVVINGSVTQTNVAFGLPVRQIRAYGSADASTNDFAYNGNGFITQTIRYSGTTDPNVTNTFYYNERGQMVDRVDALGAITFFDYDALDRPIEEDHFDEFGNPLSWSFDYYNDNGELNWADGPRFDPEDYVFYDYDGQGRRTTEIHWCSEAKPDGTGVEAPAGYNQFAQTFYQYDPLGNLTLAVDPRGAMTTNTWDALCRLVQRQHLDTNGVTVLSTEGFGYEPGGQVRYYTNALGGLTTNLYTIAGKMESRRNPDGSTNAWRYYLDGRVKREIQSNGAYWQTTYDDVNRITTRIFYSAAGVAEATNSVQLDRRGNAIQRVDEGGNAFTITYDGLDRVKTTIGPPAQGNTVQQITANYYDAAGRVTTNINALNETTVRRVDAIGRPTSKLIYNASGVLVRESYTTYSLDHNSVTVTEGSGAAAIRHTTWTDNDGHTLLAVAYPAANTTEFTLNQYDLAGNLVSIQHDSAANGALTNWTTATITYDGLNRMVQKADRDNAVTTYAYDPLNDLTNRLMPGNLQWQGTYNNAGRLLSERNVGGASSTRTNTYIYFAGGSPFAGLLWTKADGRGVICTNVYDDRYRITTNGYGGPLPEQDLTTTWQYDSRSFATNITEQFASTNTGPATTLLRAYDAYGQLASESISVGGSAFSSVGQSWDAAGRRSALNYGTFNYGFGWRPDGMLDSASDPAGSGTYSYDTAGMLTNRAVGNRITGITSRDGEGRPLSIATAVNAQPQLTETLNWSGDGLLASHTLARADFTDSRVYAYANLSRRLTQEQLNLNAGITWTNTLMYDNGVPAGPGVLTQMGQANGGSGKWSGAPDAFSRINIETNNTIQYPAYGHANTPATFSAWVDKLPVPTTAAGTNATQWRAMMELTPGPHQLTVSASSPGGAFTAWATNLFTNSIAYQATVDSYDYAGNITNRIWKNPAGAVERTQTLSWDARGRLHQVTERGTNNSGYNWTATYDGLNRRLSTTSVLVTNGVALTNSPTTIGEYYDPQVEFLEVGVSYGTNTEWKLYGPDMNGKYGGLNGTGGFDAASEGSNLFSPTISDMRGNILAVVTNGVAAWNPARTTGYGAVPGYRPLALGNGAGIAVSSAWRGKWVDITGYYQIGLRPYDPVSGRWLSYDSVWNERDPNAYSFCGGEPIMGFDADGRVVIQQWQQTQQNMLSQGGFWNNVGAAGISVGYAFMQVFSLGTFAKNDTLADQNLAGQISDSQMYTGMAINSGVALTTVAISGGTAGLVLQTGKVAAGLAVPTAFVAGGATVSVVSQGVQDAWNGQLSSAQTYEIDAVSGGVSGLTAFLTDNPYYAGAAGGATKSFLNQGENWASGTQSSFSWGNLAYETGTGVVGGYFGQAGGDGFYSSVEQQILTKMENGSIQNVAASTAQNIFANEVQTGVPGIITDQIGEAGKQLTEFFTGQEGEGGGNNESESGGDTGAGSAYSLGPLSVKY